MTRAALLGLVASSLAACGTSHDSGGEDAAITFDAAFPDAGPPDAGPPPTQIGTPCTADTDCDATDYCVTELEGGLCTRDCSTDEDCGTGSSCIVVDPRSGAAICLASCEVGETPRRCRQGYGCASGIGTTPVCLPGCIDDSDCSSGLTCDPSGGAAGEGACFTPGAEVGDACTAETDCPSGAFCRGSWPGGACVYFGCDYQTDDCPAGSTCVASGGRFGALCAAECTSNADCREGYRCSPDVTFPDRRFCNPILDPSRLGQACSGGGGGMSCTGGQCLSEASSGFPGSYCVDVGCNPSDGTGCPAGGVCVAGASGVGLCLDGCASPGDCRSGYACRPSDAEDPSSAPACLPGCTDDAQCANMGYVCNLGTGRCTEPFVASTLGQACTSVEQCAGGRCLTEAEGWPAGTCSYPGCRLSGTGPSATCPPGGVCVDDGGGDATLGVCVTACAPGGPACRGGYTCTDGACVPTT